MYSIVKPRLVLFQAYKTKEVFNYYFKTYYCNNIISLKAKTLVRWVDN